MDKTVEEVAKTIASYMHRTDVATVARLVKTTVALILVQAGYNCDPTDKDAYDIVYQCFHWDFDNDFLLVPKVKGKDKGNEKNVVLLVDSDDEPPAGGVFAPRTPEGSPPPRDGRRTEMSPDFGPGPGPSSRKRAEPECPSSPRQRREMTRYNPARGVGQGGGGGKGKAKAKE